MLYVWGHFVAVILLTKLLIRPCLQSWSQIMNLIKKFQSFEGQKWAN